MGEAAKVPDDPRDLMHEKEVYKDPSLGKLFADRELLDARNAGEIEWYDLRKGPHYSKRQLAEYLAMKRKQCQKNEPLDLPEVDKPAASEKKSASSKSATSGSGTRQAATPSTVIGMTKSLEEHAARLLEQ